MHVLRPFECEIKILLNHRTHKNLGREESTELLKTSHSKVVNQHSPPIYDAES